MRIARLFHSIGKKGYRKHPCNRWLRPARWKWCCLFPWEFRGHFSSSPSGMQPLRTPLCCLPERSKAWHSAALTRVGSCGLSMGDAPHACPMKKTREGRDLASAWCRRRLSLEPFGLMGLGQRYAAWEVGWHVPAERVEMARRGSAGACHGKRQHGKATLSASLGLAH